MDDLEYIDQIDLDFGYIKENLKDKKDFFKKLPEVVRRNVI